MSIQEKLKEAYSTATNYPSLVRNLIAIGIESYTVDTATSTILYRLKEGEHILHEGMPQPRNITLKFDRDKTFKAIKENQQGKTDYPGFMDAIAESGVRFYEATLVGNKRVTYIGSGGFYEESIPL